MIVKSTKKPESIEITGDMVRINKNIVKRTENGMEMYEYDQKVYSKDEYIKIQQEQLDNAELALAELYEMVVSE